MAESRKYDELEAKLGYRFRDGSLLEQALTHGSFRNEKGVPDNKRLAFLGDAVLQFVIGRILFDRVPEFSIGELTDARKERVKNAFLAQAAKDLELGGSLFVGEGERRNDPGEPKRLADAFEAVVGAICLDSSPGGVLEVVRRMFEPHLRQVLL